MHAPIAVSDLVRCHTCPVQFYRDRHHSRTEPDRYAVCKQLSYHLGETLDADMIWQEVTTVRPDIDPELRGFLSSCVAACRAGAWQPAIEADVPVRSEKLGIFGMVDRLGSGDRLSVVRSGTAPVTGVYTSDRLRVAAYALCLEEMLGHAVSGGYVEYIPSGMARFCIPQPRDRRMLLRALGTAHRIMEGEVPQKPLNAPCLRCEYHAWCTEGSRGKKLSDLM